MREIKFRGKTDSGKWCFGYFLHDGQRGRYVITDGLLETNRVDPETVGQYTDVMDKDGNEVYEGDILYVRMRSFFGVEEYVLEVEWQDGEFCGAYNKVGDEKSWNLYEVCNNHEALIIGNIYDDKELLKR